MKGRVYRLKDRETGKPAKTWYFTVDIGADPLTGKRKQLKRGGFRREKDALAAMNEVIGDVNRGGFKEPTRDTVAAYLTKWLDSIRPPAGNLRPTTWEGYRLLVNTYMIPRLGSIPVARLDPVQLDTLYGTLLREGGKSGSPLSQRTVSYVHTVLHRALKDGVRKGLLLRNVADMADAPGQAKSNGFSVWTAEQLRTFLDLNREHRLFPLWYLAASTGMRRGELLGLPWAEVDLDAGKLTVAQALVTSVSYEARLSEVKTSAGRRRISLDPQTVAVLRAWRKRQLEERLAWGEAWRDTGLVFSREDGTWIHPGRASDIFDGLVRRSGLPRLTRHDVRHTHATLGLKAGIPVKVMSERLGHSSIRITLDTYAHVLDGMDADAALTFGALLATSEK